MAKEEETTRVRPLLFPPELRKSFYNPSASRILIFKETETHYKHDFSVCNGCGHGHKALNPNLKSYKMSVLYSQWKALVLCKICAAQIKSGKFCSCCIQPIADVAGSEFRKCVKCSCRVHEKCIKWHKWHKVGKEPLFTCLDCLPIPNSSRKGAVVGLVCVAIDADVATGDCEDKSISGDRYVKKYSRTRKRKIDA